MSTSPAADNLEDEQVLVLMYLLSRKQVLFPCYYLTSVVIIIFRCDKMQCAYNIVFRNAVLNLYLCTDGGCGLKGGGV